MEPCRAGTQQLLAEVFDGLPTDGAVPTSVPAGPMPAVERRAALDLADELAEQTRHEAVQRLTAGGAVTGALSVTTIGALAALATDVVTMTAVQLRAVGEVLAHHDVRAVAGTSITTVALAGETEPARRRRGLLVGAGLQPPAMTRDGDIEEVLAGQIGVRVATDAVERLLRVRLQQRAVGLVPVVGAAAGAATAAWMTGRACDVARHVGRLHFLRTHAAAAQSQLVR